VANRNVILYNPTGADITVNSQTAVNGTVTKLVIADTTTDLYAFVAAGCHAMPTLAERPKLDKEAEDAGFYIQRNAEDLGRL
jgi:hypothetical protein